MSKSADAFRTISEVAEWLDTPAHVLRFWESKFTQVKPVKRAGGRRYYRPADMRLLGGIKKLLHDDGMTIKGVQKVLREQGIKHVSSLCALSLGDDEEEDDLMLLEDVPASEPVDTVVPFAKPESSQEPEETADAALAEDEPDTAAADDAVETEDSDDAQQHGHEEPEAVSDTPAAEPAEAESADAADETPPPPAEEPALPSFLQRSMEERRADPVEATQAPEPEPVAPAPAPIAEPMPRALTHLSRIERLSREQAQQIAPILERLKAVAR